MSDCQPGSDDSCTQVGLDYDNGDGVTASGQKAMMWYEEACQSGSSEGCLRA